MRQKILRLEKCWVSMDGYFRIITTVLGICIVNAWRGYQVSTNSNHRHYKIRLMDFVDMLAMDMVENTLQDQEEEDATSSFRQEIIINAIQGHDSQQSMSSLSTIANTNSPVNLGALALRGPSWNKGQGEAERARR